jgi:SAM-dependent methyltransferase
MITGALFPDISEWYTPSRIDTEEKLWANGPYKENARRVMFVLRRYNLNSVIEIGCGTGWIPSALDLSIHYLGMDANPHMLERARAKNPSRNFIQQDARRLLPLVMSDRVCSFAVLKHFSLVEWPDILHHILSVARYGLFTQHVLPDDRPAMDVGKEFHDVWPTRQQLLNAVSAAGHGIVSIDDYSAIDIGVGAPEAYVTTRRR